VGADIKNPCEPYNKWYKKYQKIYNKSAKKGSKTYFKVISELEKIHQEERNTYAKNSENR
jgi:hypothetical protein